MRGTITVRDMIEHLQTLPPYAEVWIKSDTTGEYFPATEPQARMQQITRVTKTSFDGRKVETWVEPLHRRDNWETVCVMREQQRFCEACGTKDGVALSQPEKSPYLRCECGFVGEPDSKHLVTYQDVWPELTCPQCKKVIQE